MTTTLNFRNLSIDARRGSLYGTSVRIAEGGMVIALRQPIARNVVTCYLVRR